MPTPRWFLSFVFLGLPLLGQTVLFPVLDMTAPGNPDNHSAFFVVQPSRHGQVLVLPLLTGDTGSQSLPIISLEGRYQNDNLSAATSFCSLDSLEHLVFPNPFIPQTQAWLALVGPLSFGVLTPMTPAIEVSRPEYADVATYFQTVEVLQTSSNPVLYDFHFSNGVTMVQTEAQGSNLSGPVVAAGRRGAAMAAGDFNGDGVDDLAVGAPGDSGGGLAAAGRVYLYVGLPRTASSAGGLHPVPYVLEEPDLSSVLAGENPGPEVQAHFGAALAAGDVDGDGIDELVVGVPEGDGVASEPDQGEVYVYRALEGFAVPAALALPQILNVPAAAIVQFRPVIERAFARYGTEITVGDLNADLVDDVVVSAPFIDVSQVAEQEIGNVYVRFGPVLGAPSFVNEDQRLEDPAIASFEHFGGAVAIGDLDADNQNELVVGVPGEANGAVSSSGKIVAFRFNGTGFVPMVNLVPAAPVSWAGFGLSLAAGDIDGDGRDDVITASDETVGGHAYAGMVHVHRMGPGFTVAGYEAIGNVVPADYERFGRKLLVQDMNDDGIADVVVGAPGCPTAGHTFSGQVFVYFGNPSPVLNDSFRTLWVDSTTPSTYALFGSALAAGDFAGVGVNDLAVGEPLGWVSGIPGAGRIAVYDDLLHRKDNLNLSQWLSGAPPSP